MTGWGGSVSVAVVSTSGESAGFTNSGWRNLTAFAGAHGWCPADPDAEAFTADEMTGLAEAIDVGLAGRSEADVGAELTRVLVTPAAPDSTLFRADPIRFDARAFAYWQPFALFARRGAARVES